MKKHDLITQALRRANPLNDEDFVKEIHLALLRYNDHDKLPRKVEQTFLIRDIWNAVGNKDTTPAFEARFTGAALPSYHAILAEALHCQETGEHPDFHGLHEFAKRTMRTLLVKQLEEIGVDETYEALRHQFLLAAAQLARTGFSGQSLESIVLIAGLAHLHGYMQKYIRDMHHLFEPENQDC